MSVLVASGAPKPRILFFARGYQAEFYPELLSDRYEAVFVTMTLAEKRQVEAKGQAVAGCFEEEFDRIPPADVPENYLRTSLVSDRFLGEYSDRERMDILGKEIAFWRSLLDRHTPVAVMNEIVAIEISEVLLIETQQRGIDYLAPMHCPFDDWFYWIDNPMTLSGRFIARAEPGKEARELAGSFVRSIKEKDYAPFYVQNLGGRFAAGPFLKAVAKLVQIRLQNLRNSLSSRFQYEKMEEIYAKRVSTYLRSVYRGYDRLESVPSDCEVVYYPLHQEPEATLAYMSEFYANQAATIENVLKCLSPGQVLIVKEHPIDRGSLLQDKFWKLRDRYSGLYFLPGEVPSRPVIGRASRVVTLASTVGLEALIANKAVYVLGEAFYDALPGVAVGSWKELREALRAPVTQPTSEDDIREYIAGIVELAHRGSPFESEVLHDQANCRRIVEAIIDRLDQKGLMADVGLRSGYGEGR